MKDMTTDKTTKPEKNDSKNVIDNVTGNEYKYGFTTDIDTDIIPRGLNEDVVRFISAKKESRNGCLNSASKRFATGSRSPLRSGRILTFLKLTFRP